MSMTFREIAAMALDEWESENDVERGGIGGPLDVESAELERVIAEDGIVTGIKNLMNPKAGGGATGGAKPKGEAAQAMATAQKSPGQQMMDITEHDRVRHPKGFHPENGDTCVYRDKMAEAMTAMGTLKEGSPLAKQLGEHAIKAGKEAAKNQKGEGKDPELTEIQRLNEKRRSLRGNRDSEEYKAAETELNQKRDEYLKKKLGEAECGAVNKLTELANKPSFKDKVKAFVDKLRGKQKEAEAKGEEDPLSPEQDIAVEKIEESVEMKPVPEEELEATKLKSDEEAVGEEKADTKPEESSTTETKAEESPKEEETITTEKETEETENPDTETSAETGAEGAEGESETGAETEGSAEASAEEPKRKTRQELADDVAQAKKEHEDAVRNHKSKEELAAAREKLKNANAALQKRTDKPEPEDLLEDLDAARGKLDAAKQELERLKGTDESGKTVGSDKEIKSAEEAVSEAEEEVNKADEAFHSYEPEPEEGESGHDGDSDGAGEASETSERGEPQQREFTIKGKQYVDVSNMGFFEGMAAAFKAGWDGKDIITDWDKMSGRWDQLKATDPKFAESLKNLQQGTAGEKIKSDTAKMLEEMKNNKDLSPEQRMAASAALSAIQSGKDEQKAMKEFTDTIGRLDKNRRSGEESAAKKALTEARTKGVEEKSKRDAEMAEIKKTLEASKVRKQTVAESDPGTVAGIEAELNDPNTPAEVKAVLNNILPVLKEAKSVAEVNKALDRYVKLPGVLHKERMTALKAQNAEEDNMEKTWAETNEERNNQLTEAIKKAEKGNPALAADLKKIQDQLATTHSAKEALRLVDKWRSLTSPRASGKGKKTFDYDAYEPVESTKKEYEAVDKTAMDSELGKIMSRDTKDWEHASLSDSATDPTLRQKLVNGKQTLDQVFQGLNLNNVSVEDVVDGPSVTNYALSIPRNGTLSKSTIESIKDQIETAFGLDENSPAIVTKMGGKIVVQIPKKESERDTVNFGDLYRSPEFTAAKQKFALPVIIGRDTAGKPIIEDLSNLKHLLIAGETGGGKSVCLNTILTSLLAAKDAGELDMDLVDLKAGLELGRYEDMPHLRNKIATTGDEAMSRIVDFKKRMDSVLKKLHDAKVQNIQQYNEKFPNNKLKMNVLGIDEVADLMSKNPEAAEPLSSIAALGRAAGFHLIVATQRPEAKVLPGLIKDNIPSTIALKTRDGINSGIILGRGHSEAKDLLGNGDLILQKGKDFIRAQGAFISNDEQQKINSTITKAYKEKPGAPKPTLPSGGGGTTQTKAATASGTTSPQQQAASPTAAPASPSPETGSDNNTTDDSNNPFGSFTQTQKSNWEKIRNSNANTPDDRRELSRNLMLAMSDTDDEKNSSQRFVSGMTDDEVNLFFDMLRGSKSRDDVDAINKWIDQRFNHDGTRK